MRSWSIHRWGRSAANRSTEPAGSEQLFYLAGDAQRLDVDTAGGSGQLGCHGRPDGVAGTSGVGIDADRRAARDPAASADAEQIRAAA